MFIRDGAKDQRSDRNLNHLSVEYNRARNAQPLKQPANDKQCNNEKMEGTYEAAAYNAFNAAVTRDRPPSRQSEGQSRISLGLEVDRALKQKLSSTSKAIDSLRDQVSLLSNEVKEVSHQQHVSSNNQLILILSVKYCMISRSILPTK
jgi:hypothetical protein